MATITGDGDDNLLLGTSGDDSISGGAGDDTIVGTLGHDTIDGSAGFDLLTFANSPTGANTSNDVITGVEKVVGSPYADTLILGISNATISGGDGDDSMAVFGDNDVLDGGPGVLDGVYFRAHPSVFHVAHGVVANLTTGLSTFDIGGGHTLTYHLTGIEVVVGTDYADTLTGGQPIDWIQGEGGNDVINGGLGYDGIIFSDAPHGVRVDLSSSDPQTIDTVTNQQLTLTSIERVEGSNYSDTLTGGTADNGFLPLGGNDAPDGSEHDSVDGGTGFDWVDYQNSPSCVTVDLASGVASGAWGSDTLAGIEMAIGSNYDDTLSGGSGDDSLMGLGGDDVLDGRGGVDTASYGDNTSVTGGVTVDLSITGPQDTGSAGKDTLISIENLAGTQFADTLSGDSGPNEIWGAGGGDLINGGAGNDVLHGGSPARWQTQSDVINIDGDDTINGGAGDDTIDGGAGADLLDGGPGDDSISGGDGDDTIVGGAGHDTIDGGAGVNVISFAGASSGANYTVGPNDAANSALTGHSVANVQELIGSAFADTLTSGVNNFTLSGGAGDDILIGYNDGDVLDGGPGSLDVADFNTHPAAFKFALTVLHGVPDDVADALTAHGVMADLGAGTASYVLGTQTQHYQMTGVEVLFGTSYADTLTGGLPVDWILPGGGDDVINGGDGVDGVDYETYANGVHVDLSVDGVAQVVDPVTGQTNKLTSIENLLGSAHDDTISGSAVANWLLGGAGADQISGGDGDDTLTGGAGDDSLNGGAGQDVAVFSGLLSQSTITANDDGSLTVVGPDGSDTLSGVETLQFADGVADFAPPSSAGASESGTSGSDSLVGAGGDDTLSGGAGDDTLVGGDGNDSVAGGAGNDLIVAGHGGGNDLYDGGPGIDTIRYASATKTVTVDLAAGTGSGPEVGHDTISNVENVIGGSGNDSIAGDAGANQLTGGDGNDDLAGRGGDDTIDGGAGNDNLTGGAGADKLIGGAGADTFVFTSVGDSTPGAPDTIVDFSHADHDHIDLSGIDAVAGGKDDAFTLVTAFTQKAGQLTVTFETDHYVVRGDVNGDGVADFAINVYSATPLTSGDFVL
jgi:Ca2+-binding RTX toxin-like protein